MTALTRLRRLINRFINWLAFFFCCHGKLAKNYEFKSEEKIFFNGMLEKGKNLPFILKGKEVCAIIREAFHFG